MADYYLEDARKSLEAQLSTDAFIASKDPAILRKCFVKDWHGLERGQNLPFAASENDYAYSSKLFYANTDKSIEECVLVSIQMLKALEEFAKCAKETELVKSRMGSSFRRHSDDIVYKRQWQLLSVEKAAFEQRYKACEFKFLESLEERKRLPSELRQKRIKDAEVKYSNALFVNVYYQILAAPPKQQKPGQVDTSRIEDLLQQLVSRPNVDMKMLESMMSVLLAQSAAPAASKENTSANSPLPRITDRTREINAVTELISKYPQIVPDEFKDDVCFYQGIMSGEEERVRAITAAVKHLGRDAVANFFVTQ